MGLWPHKVIRGCVGKIRHPSKGKADAAIRSLKKRDDIGVDVDNLNSYWCVRCRHWHVGHRDEAHQ
jgi:hypothetical protein